MSDSKEQGTAVGRWVDRHLKEPVQKVGSGRHAPRMYKIAPALIGLGVGSVFGVWLIVFVLSRIDGAKASVLWFGRGSLGDVKLYDLIRSVAVFAAIFGGLFAILYAYRKQRVEEAAGHRADAEGLAKRYQDAAEQLGHEKAAVRLAGVYAMARLADEWEAQRQTCIDVLCAYLRMTPHRIDTSLDAQDLEVRKTVQRAIHERVLARDRHDGAWAPYAFNLSGAVLHDANFSSAEFRGGVDFTGCTFLGDCDLRMTLLDSAKLDRIYVEGTLTIFPASTRKYRQFSLSDVKVAKTGKVNLLIDDTGPRKFVILRGQVLGDLTIDLGLFYKHPGVKPAYVYIGDLRVADGARMSMIYTDHVTEIENEAPARVEASDWGVGNASVSIDELLMTAPWFVWGPHTGLDSVRTTLARKPGPVRAEPAQSD